jgi:hypothetical protein
MKRVALLAVLMVATRAAAQEPRLERVDPAARAPVAALLDSARATGLSTEPLIQRALEGTTKGAPADRVIAAVRRLVADLGRAREALGPSAAPPEIEAGAAALRAGAPPSVLTQLRVARRPPLTMALAVLADLVASGVPADRAAAAVLTLASTARDADLLEFRRAVERDIALGAPPAAATAVRLDASARAARPGRP